MEHLLDCLPVCSTPHTHPPTKNKRGSRLIDTPGNPAGSPHTLGAGAAQ
jgi:hypothetical protein